MPLLAYLSPCMMSVSPPPPLASFENYPETIAPATRATNPSALPPILAAAPVLFGAMAGDVDGPVREDAGFVMADVPVAVLLEFRDKDEVLVVTLTKYKEPPVTMSAGETALSIFAAAFAKAAWVCSLNLHELGIYILVRG